MFGVQSTDEELQEGEIQLAVGRTIPLLTELSAYVSRIYVVFANVIRQLGALYHPKQKLYDGFVKGVRLVPVFEELCRTLTHTMALDELLSRNAALQSAWGKYGMMMRAVVKEPARFGATEEEALRLDKLVRALQTSLFERDAVLLTCINQAFDYEGVVEVRANKTLRNEVVWHLTDLLRRFNASMDAANSSSSSSNSSNNRAAGLREDGLIPGFYGLLLLHSSVWGGEGLERKFYAAAAEYARKRPVVPLWANRVWWAADFVALNFSQVVKSGYDPMRAKRDFLSAQAGTLGASVQELSTYVCVWMSRMESNYASRTALRQGVELRAHLAREAVFLARRVSFLFRSTVALHAATAAQLSVPELRALCHCLVLLKALEGCVHRRMAAISEVASLTAQRVCHAMLGVLAPVRSALEQAPKLSPAKLDALAAAAMAIGSLRGCATRERRAVLAVAVALVEATVAKEKSAVAAAELRAGLAELEGLLGFQRDLARYTDCAGLYWSREIIPHEFGVILGNPKLAHTLQYLLSALDDVVPLMKSAVHATDPKVLLERYRAEVEGFLKSRILEPLQRDIDEDLRFQTHLHLQVTDRNPFHDGVRDYARILALRPLLFMGRYYDIRSEVAHHLDEVFYDTNTVALFDWRTYEVMRSLARSKYGLPMTDVYLPSQTIEQGLDVLEIMRNIQIFVARYNYNMNNQFFVERQSDSKTLNTIGIANIANSIRTHGTGIMNTTVNFTYQYLKNMFDAFSQFLFDEHIKGRLMKEIKFFRENKEDLAFRYPFDRAERFNKDIRKLGTTDGNKTYLDRFRILVTQIGNAMGYIRMIRSGGLLACARAMKFVPDLQNIVSFEELTTKEGLSPETAAAAKTLDLAIANLSQSFEGGFDYFELLIEVFKGEFRNPENRHFRNFYAILPALTLNFVDYLLEAKEKVLKKASQLHADGYVFCDDGFVVGIAYILTLLNQTAEFDSLHWFDTVRIHYAQKADELQRIAASSRSSRKSKEQAQTSVLTIRKLQAYQAEFDLLRYSFAGAKIFFGNEPVTNDPSASGASSSSSSSSSAADAPPAPPPADTVSGDNSAGAPPPPPPPPLPN